MAFDTGQVIGEYEIVRVLGSGGHGSVYEAKHLISQRSEALKVLRPEQMDTPEMAERFRREIQVLGSLNHPNIARLHNAFYFEEQLVMIMELVEGENLRSRSLRMRIPLSQLVDFASEVLAALDYAHQLGVVHRDLKPSNIMLDNKGSVKLLDFGIATKERAPDLTATGSFIGSPTHMSPEQFRGERATPQSDFYSLGVTLYELIAGQPPMQGANMYDLMMAHLHKVPVPLRSLRPDIPVHLSDVIARALAKEPARRFTTAAEFLAELRLDAAVVSPEATTASQVSSWQRISTDEFNKPSTGTGAVLLEPVIRNLAAYIGPIAKIVVNRLAKQYSDLDKIYTEASKHIENDADRQRFLRSRPR